MQRSSGKPLFRSWLARIDGWEWVWLIAPAVVVLVIGFVIAWQFVKPAPPERVVIAAGARGGAYWQFAEAYSDYFNRNGIQLELRETEGSVENYRLLLDPKSGVDVAIVQGGTAPPAAREALEGVAAIDLEPIWIFHRADLDVSDLNNLKDLRVAVGSPSSGTRHAALALLHAVGLIVTTPTDDNADDAAPLLEQTQLTLVEIGGREAAEQLRAGRIDAAIFVSAPSAGFLKDLAADPALRLLPFRRAPAFARRYSYFHEITLHEGVLDLQHNLPAQDIPLIATTAAIVARQDTHSAVIQLLVQAATRVHERGSVVSPAGEYPSELVPDVPISSIARHHLQTGPNWLQRQLPFWAASLVSRLWILLLPLLTLMLPLMRIAPPLYRWRTRAKVYRWYKRVRRIDDLVHDNDATLEQLRDARAEAELIETDISRVNVPLSYMDEFYDLRLHLKLVEEQIARRIEGKS